MDEQLSLIETQFPVSKVSKESYKERKAVQSQTLTGMGRWWGRKPLSMVRAALLGMLLPATDDPQKDMENFLRLMCMDDEGLFFRLKKPFSVKELYQLAGSNPKYKNKLSNYFESDGKKIKLNGNVDKDELSRSLFNDLGYDEKLSYCDRSEQINSIDTAEWQEINKYYKTDAHSISDFVKQLSTKRFGKVMRVGDAFCGGGSIPFEASRLGFNTYASDLNPIAGLLTWSSINISGAGPDNLTRITKFQNDTYDEVFQTIDRLGVDKNDLGDQALGYMYCIEANCPECGRRVPLLSSYVIGKRAGKVIAKLIPNNSNGVDIVVLNDVSEEEFKKAGNSFTVSGGTFYCPCCGKTSPMSKVKGDRWDKDGNTISGLRKLRENEFTYAEGDVFSERLYAIRYLKSDGTRYYCKPSLRDLNNEKKIKNFIAENLTEWQQKGYIPSAPIIPGQKTNELIEGRGWQYWHQLFSARHLFYLGILNKLTLEQKDPILLAVGALGINKCTDFASKLCSWASSVDISTNTFYNQALNPLVNWGERSFYMLKAIWNWTINSYPTNKNSVIKLSDARDVDAVCDFWVTDPPYADAVMYHELSEYFLSWDKGIINKLFPDWTTDSRRILAVKGDDHFSQTMIDIYSNLAKHMPDNGMQIVMFTHSDPAVWAQLAIIMWRAGLRVTAAWNIATETDASGLKNGNYVKGTVLLVLRKQKGSDIAFLDEINADIREEVKRQISSMQQLDDKEEPNFSDPDYVLAAYAASLKVLTSYKEIEDLNLDYELNKAISDPSNSKVVAIIENAKKIAYDCVIPTDFDNYFWRELTNAEKFYIKGLESEKHGNYQIGTYQEFARGFSIGGYSQLMASERANSARLKTPYEMGDRSLNDVPDFQNSLMRTVFEGIYVAIKNDMNPSRGLDFIKNDIPNYWDKREMIQQILSFLVDINDISNMQEHWADSAKMADALLTVVKHDSI